jgi:signal transduction histidine kinase
MLRRRKKDSIKLKNRITKGEKMTRSGEELHYLVSRLHAAREEERISLARELHDNLGQTLTCIKLDLALLTRHAGPRVKSKNQRDSVALAEEMAGLIDGAISTVQSISTRLRPALLDIMGFWPALEAEAAQFASRTGIKCGISSSGRQWNPGRPEVATEVFRIVQEVLTNVARHSGASSVMISCTKSDDGHILSIIDDGKGICEADTASLGSLGIIGMRERARSFGGGISIDGSPGRGCRVTVTIPDKAPSERA